MPSRRLHPDTLLSIQISCVMSRNQYTSDPGPVIEELYAVAGGRLDVLAPEVGRWIGFYEDDYTRTLTTALRALPLDMGEWITLGQAQRITDTPHPRIRP